MCDLTSTALAPRAKMMIEVPRHARRLPDYDVGAGFRGAAGGTVWRFRFRSEWIFFRTWYR